MSDPVQYEINHIPGSSTERIVWLAHELNALNGYYVMDRGDFGRRKLIRNSLIAYKLVLDHPRFHQPYPPLPPPDEAEIEGIGQLYSRPRPVIIDLKTNLDFEGLAAITYLHEKHRSVRFPNRFVYSPGDPRFATYTYWLHWVEKDFEPNLRKAIWNWEQPVMTRSTDKAIEDLAILNAHLKAIEQALMQNDWLAGDKLTLADIMVVHPLTRVRCVFPEGTNMQDVFEPRYPYIYRFLHRIKAPSFKFSDAMTECGVDVDAVFGARPTLGSLALEPRQSFLARGFDQLAQVAERVSTGLSRVSDFLDSLPGDPVQFDSAEANPTIPNMPVAQDNINAVQTVLRDISVAKDKKALQDLVAAEDSSGDPGGGFRNAWMQFWRGST